MRVFPHGQPLTALVLTFLVLVAAIVRAQEDVVQVERGSEQREQDLPPSRRTLSRGAMEFEEVVHRYVRHAVLELQNDEARQVRWCVLLPSNNEDRGSSIAERGVTAVIRKQDSKAVIVTDAPWRWAQPWMHAAVADLATPWIRAVLTDVKHTAILVFRDRSHCSEGDLACHQATLNAVAPPSFPSYLQATRVECSATDPGLAAHTAAQRNSHRRCVMKAQVVPSVSNFAESDPVLSSWSIWASRGRSLLLLQNTTVVLERPVCASVDANQDAGCAGVGTDSEVPQTIAACMETHLELRVKPSHQDKTLTDRLHKLTHLYALPQYGFRYNLPATVADATYVGDDSQEHSHGLCAQFDGVTLIAAPAFGRNIFHVYEAFGVVLQMLLVDGDLPHDAWICDVNRILLPRTTADELPWMKRFVQFVRYVFAKRCANVWPSVFFKEHLEAVAANVLMTAKTAAPDAAAEEDAQQEAAASRATFAPAPCVALRGRSVLIGHLIDGGGRADGAYNHTKLQEMAVDFAKDAVPTTTFATQANAEQRAQRRSFDDPVRVTILVRPGGPGTPRSIVNLPAVREALRTPVGHLDQDWLDTHIVDPATLTFDEQVLLADATDIWVAMHGAVHTNAIFLKPHSAVIELVPGRWYQSFYGPITRAAGALHFLLQETNPARLHGCQDVAEHCAQYDLFRRPATLPWCRDGDNDMTGASSSSCAMPSSSTAFSTTLPSSGADQESACLWMLRMWCALDVDVDSLRSAVLEAGQHVRHYKRHTIPRSPEAARAEVGLSAWSTTSLPGKDADVEPFTCQNLHPCSPDIRAAHEQLFAHSGE